jgi:Outer membrane protein beta-barrel domain
MANLKQPLMLASGVVAAATGASAQSALDGFYAGVSFGEFTADETSAGYDGFDGAAGTAVFIGYDHAFSTFFVGGELAYNLGNLESSDTFEDYSGSGLLDMKVRFGKDFDKIKVYGFAGYSKMQSDEYSGVTFSGANYGLGAAYALNDSTDVGLEYIKRNFGDSEDGAYTDSRTLSTISLRVGFNF